MRQKLSFLLSLADTDIALTSLQCKITSFQAAEEKGHKTTKSGQNCSLAWPVISVVKTKKSCPAPTPVQSVKTFHCQVDLSPREPGPDDDYNLNFLYWRLCDVLCALQSPIVCL